MASRATETEVKEIMDTTLTEEQLSPFLKAANSTVTGLLSDEGYGDTQLAEIERWLAAHFASCAKDQIVSKEKIGGADATYHGKTGMGLESTFYGQTVKTLEYNGVLAQVEAAKSRSIIEVIDWVA
jgi:hypothetical protein